MDKTTVISLNGHTRRYSLEQDAYDRLARYLDRAASRLQADPDRAEVLGDLERSVGDKLDVLLGADDRLVTSADIEGILDEIGAVDTGHGPSPEEAAPPPPARRLQRIREGQMLVGVCNGLAAYADIRVDWVRTLFVFATLLTGGLFVVVYVVMAFILPVAPTREAS